MNIEDIRDYCLLKEFSEEGFPFDQNTLVFSIGKKIFALLDLEKRILNIKSIPEDNIALREQYPFIIPGYHMNKKHWNTILLNENPDSEIIKHLIDQSYTIIRNKLTKKLKNSLGI